VCGAIDPLVTMLNNNGREAEVAARTLWKISRDGDNKKAIVHANAIPPLVNLLSSGTAKAKENAAGVLCYIAFKNENNKAAIVHANAIPPLVTLAKSGSLMIAKKL